MTRRRSRAEKERLRRKRWIEAKAELKRLMEEAKPKEGWAANPNEWMAAKRAALRTINEKLRSEAE